MNGAFYHVHWYKYPLTYWLTSSHRWAVWKVVTWISLIFLNRPHLDGQQPDHHSQSGSCHFANPIAQGACAADAIASAFICLSMFCSGVPVRREVCTRSWLGE